MAAELPAELKAAIAALLEGRSRKDVTRRSAMISRGYRDGAISQGVVRDERDALAYAVSRMPATYAATRDVLDRLLERCPGFAPALALDVGCGPGTASWALADAFPDVAAIIQIDRNAAFLSLARDLSEQANAAPLRAPRQVEADLNAFDGLPERCDLAVLSYALAELPVPRIAGLLATLWTGCTGALVIVEPGTPDGYRRILSSRDVLLDAGARLLAPCPHEAGCPLVPPDWCHFSVRLPRSRDHRAAKSATLSYEDEKFSYLVAVSEALFAPAEAGRILERPDVTKIGLSAKICTPDGAARLATVPKRDKTAFAAARRARWGDELQSKT